MSDKPDVTNSVRGPTGRAGDLPEAVRKRYLAERRLDGSIAYFADATVLIPSFRDAGRRLVAARSDPATIRDLLAVAQHRGWRAVEVRGAAGFRREAWMVGQALGIDVRGYRPTERDREGLQRRQAQTELRRTHADRPGGGVRHSLDLRDPRGRLRVVEAVVRDRIEESAERARILAAARARAAELQRQQDATRSRGR